MTPLNQLQGWACPLPLANVDTDQLIPARFMKTPRSQGYGDYLLHDLRRDESGALHAAWPLNRPEGRQAQVLVARKNFGAGSSREAAVYALVDHGFRCVVAPSFGDIFASNAVNNGLLPAVMPAEDVERLLAVLGDACQRVSLDLERQVIDVGGATFAFDIRPNWKTKLFNGWDDISLTLSMAAEIGQYRAGRQAQLPWLFP